MCQLERSLSSLYFRPEREQKNTLFCRFAMINQKWLVTEETQAKYSKYFIQNQPQNVTAGFCLRWNELHLSLES